MATTLPDHHGNRVALEGCDRCLCGAKYWERDVCQSCGARHPAYATVHVTLYGGHYRGTRIRPNANPVLDAMRDDDLGDPWGTGLSWAWAVCQYLHHVALSDDIPEGLGYSPAPFTPRGDDGFEDEDYPSQYIVEMGLDTFTLVQAARCLDRYLDWCKAAGRDY